MYVHSHGYTWNFYDFSLISTTSSECRCQRGQQNQIISNKQTQDQSKIWCVGKPQLVTCSSVNIYQRQEMNYLGLIKGPEPLTPSHHFIGWKTCKNSALGGRHWPDDSTKTITTDWPTVRTLTNWKHELTKAKSWLTPTATIKQNMKGGQFGEVDRFPKKPHCPKMCRHLLQDRNSDNGKDQIRQDLAKPRHRVCWQMHFSHTSHPSVRMLDVCLERKIRALENV